MGQGSDINEQSPLIGAERNTLNIDVEGSGAGPISPLSPLSPTSQAESDGDFAVDEPIESKSVWYLILLTLSIGGLQIVWSVELSNGSPYLLSLGMSKALVAFVWVAGPVTGVLVQPYIGLRSDRCRNSWGRRKPFMLAGTLGTALTSLLLAYAKDIMSVFGGLAADAKYEGAWRTMTIIFATVLMWCLDFSINTVQAAIRAFICDGAPAHQQEAANAWASRMTGIGSVIGYLFGYLDLPQYFSFFGNTQFKVLVTIASISLTSTVLISILSIPERNPQLDPPSSVPADEGVLAFFKQTYTAVKRLPPQISSVCQIQFFHWIGWFPFLFYITTYIGQLYVDPDLEPGLSDEDVDALWAKATRIGTLALLIYAIVSLSANIILPFLVIPSYNSDAAIAADETQAFAPTSPIGVTRASSYIESRPNSIAGTTDGPPSFFRRFLARLQVPGLTLRRTWLLSQLLFVGCMFSTFFIFSFQAATVMTALVGICWSLTLWAPFALISADIAQRDEARRRRARQKLLNPNEEWHQHEEGDQAGIILGLHNVAVSAPQVFSTMVCSAIFKILQKPRDEPGDTSVGWTLRFGGLTTLIAVWLTYRMKEPGERTIS
jgi:solute carrier family 45, member 1/2/4